MELFVSTQNGDHIQKTLWLAKLIHPKLRLYKQKGFHKREDQTRRNVFVLIETNMASSNEHKELSKANIVALSQVYVFSLERIL